MKVLNMQAAIRPLLPTEILECELWVEHVLRCMDLYVLQYRQLSFCLNRVGTFDVPCLLTLASEVEDLLMQAICRERGEFEVQAALMAPSV